MKIKKIYEKSINDTINNTIFSEYFDLIQKTEQLNKKILKNIKEWLNNHFDISKKNKGRSDYTPECKITSFQIWGNELRIDYLKGRGQYGIIYLDQNDTEDLLSYIEDPSTYEDRKIYNL